MSVYPTYIFQQTSDAFINISCVACVSLCLRLGTSSLTGTSRAIIILCLAVIFIAKAKVDITINKILFVDRAFKTKNASNACFCSYIHKKMMWGMPPTPLIDTNYV